jgi:hypothetical protein
MTVIAINLKLKIVSSVMSEQEDKPIVREEMTTFKAAFGVSYFHESKRFLIYKTEVNEDDEYQELELSLDEAKLLKDFLTTEIYRIL